MFGISIVPSINTNLISATTSTMLTNATRPIRDVNIGGNNKKLSKNRILENYEIITNFYLIGKQNKIGIFQLPDHLYGIIKKFLPDILMRSDMDIKAAVSLWYWNKSYAIKKYGHISNWNTKYVTDMSNLFSFGSDEFNEDISKWNVQNVTNMDCMFIDPTKVNCSLSKWNVQNVKNIDRMFKDTTKFNLILEYYEIITNFYLIGKQYRIGIFQLPDHLHGMIKKFLFLPDILTRSDMDINDAVRLWYWNKSDAIKKYGHISKWKTNYVTDMSNLFSFRNKEFNEDISKWNVQNVKCMDSMFHGVDEFNGDLSNWNVQNVESMNYMFKDAAKFNCDLSKWNVKNVKCMDSMFQGAAEFNGDLSNWNVQNVESMRFMFKGAAKFNCDLSNWNAHTIKKLSNIKQMFDNCNISKNHKIKFCIQDSSTEGYNYYIYGDYSYYDKDGYYSDKYIDLRHKDEQRQKFELRRKHGKIKVDSLNYDYSSYIQIYNNYEEDGYTTEDSYDSDYWDDPDYDD